MKSSKLVAREDYEVFLMFEKVVPYEIVINKYGRIIKLDLKENKLTSLPKCFGNLVYLQDLSLAKNHFTSLPESFGNLVNLQSLDLEKNKLTSLPESFSNLVNLQKLNLCCNRLAILPDNFSNLVNLQELILRVNKLTFLPNSFGNLVNLNSLELNDNEFTSLPESFSNLVNLQKLNLESNKLITLPNGFENLINLQEFNLKGNKIINLSNIDAKVLKIAKISPDHLLPKGKSLYNSRRKNKLYEYYRKSPRTLAQQYITDSNSLTSDEKERLTHEAGHLEKKILELKVNPDDPILVQITERLAVELSNGLKMHL